MLKAFEIVDSAKARRCARELMTQHPGPARRSCARSGWTIYGDPSAIVAVKMGTEGLARLVSRRLPELGLLANLVEYPAVGKGAARFRMQVMANHTVRNIEDAVVRLRRAYDIAVREVEGRVGKSAGAAA